MSKVDFFLNFRYKSSINKLNTEYVSQSKNTGISKMKTKAESEHTHDTNQETVADTTENKNADKSSASDLVALLDKISYHVDHEGELTDLEYTTVERMTELSGLRTKVKEMETVIKELKSDLFLQLEPKFGPKFANEYSSVVMANIVLGLVK